MTALPADDHTLEALRREVWKAIAPLKILEATTETSSDVECAEIAEDLDLELPDHYLIYLLLVNFLGFEDWGPHEKVAWTIPIDFEGRQFLIILRKFGLKIETGPDGNWGSSISNIRHLLRRGVAVGKPFFEKLASDAIRGSDLNVANKSAELWERYRFLREQHETTNLEAIQRKDEMIRVVAPDEPIDGEFIFSIFATSLEVSESRRNESGEYHGASYYRPSPRLQMRASWLAHSAVEAFFGWSEHLFIHFSILRGQTTTGTQVSKMALEKDWAKKYGNALNLRDSETRTFFKKLKIVRQKIRNVMAHGAVGHDGGAFEFHSDAGAIPIRLPSDPDSFQLGEDLTFDVEETFELFGQFYQFLKSTSQYEARFYYAMESGLPTILRYAADGVYSDAIKTKESMEEFVDVLSRQSDDVANMDW